MLYTCTNCQQILPTALAMDLKKCPLCGRTPNLEFKTADALLRQGYSHYDAPDPDPHTPQTNPAPYQGSAPIPNEKPSPATPQGVPQPPTARGGNSRTNWMNQPEPPAPNPTIPRHPAPRHLPPDPVSSTSGSRSAPLSQSSTTVAPPTKRPGNSPPAVTGGSTIEGGPIGNTSDRFGHQVFNFSFISQLLILLAIILIAGIMIYSIWSMREQIVQTLTAIFTFLVIGAVAIFLLRRRF